LISDLEKKVDQNITNLNKCNNIISDQTKSTIKSQNDFKDDLNNTYNQIKSLQNELLRKNNSIDKLNGYYGKLLMNSMNDSYKTMPDSDYPEHIDLSNNHLRQLHIIPFIRTLRKKLKTLNLRNNKLGPLGCVAFSNFLLDNPLTNLT
jgi:hypothetical protein